MRLPKNRQPITPGEILTEEFLLPLGLTQAKLAEHLGWTTTKVNQIAKNKRAITPETALALADAFGTTAHFWLNAQLACDLWSAKQAHVEVTPIHEAMQRRPITGIMF